MSFPIRVEERGGRFAAFLVGAPNVRAEEPTRSRAIAALKAEIRQLIEFGELLCVDVEPIGISDLVGKYRNDPTLREICQEAYRRRDAERDS